MTPEKFRQLRRAFEDLVSVSGEEQSALLAQLAGQDPVLADELRRMVAAYASPTGLLDCPLAEAAVAPHSGSQFGPYRIGRELGRGGMGIVYEAERADGSFQLRVAIKILRHRDVDGQFARRFQQERQILAQLNHPHIAGILDGGTTPQGDPYFVMEYVDGVPITGYCEVHSLTVDQKLGLFLQICDAVQHAHRNLTVHRDLKPGNILVTASGAVKLLDFGIAKLLDSGAAQSAGAPATVAVLTPEYASPEQILNQPITTAADVFSLGILLYELLCGAHPFRGAARLPHEVMRAIAEEDPPPPALPGDLSAIVLTALRKQPPWRYPSVEQLAEDIDRYRRGRPVLAKGDRVWYRFRKFARRQWLPLAAAAALVFALGAGAVATLSEARAAERARMQAEGERRIAEQQRLLAEQSRQTALRAQGLAEVRTAEAETERRKEQQRYREVRSLAASLLFDLHDGIRDLAGSTTARRLIVAKAQQQLELLSAEAGDDIAFERDVAASYERMGELRVDPRHPNKNDAGSALDAYRHAADLRRKIARRAGAQPRDRRDLALSLTKLGDGEVMAAHMPQAMTDYAMAWKLAQSLARQSPQDVSMQRALGAVDERRCIALLTSGNTAGALGSCQEGIATLTPLAKTAPDDVEVERLLASTEASYANALRLSRKPLEAVAEARLALAALGRLEVLAPNNAEYRRMASSAQTILAGSLAASGDNPASLEAFRHAVRAMEIAVEIDPTDLNSPLRLAVTLLAFSRRLAGAGDKDSSHQAAQEALHLLEQATGKPGAGAVEWNEYADALLKVEWPDLAQPGKAMELARHAVAATNRANPFFLDTLAWAYFRTGDAARAVETERDALRLLPADAKGGLHDELERGLNTFQGVGSH